MKAREIIPGWPRGRSTSSNYTVGSTSARTLQEYEFELSEETRKANMMRQYYDEKMCEAMGDFVSDIRCPWNPTWPDAVRRLRPLVQRMAERERQFWKDLGDRCNADNS
jgi:hypothetical protein